ncbi:MAG: DUF2400 family protein, partial [Bdellovibrionota bacterium]
MKSDPIQFPKMFFDPKDQEIVALISALYAFGNVKMIFNSLKNILSFLDRTPHQKLMNLNNQEIESFPFITHRWIKPSDTRSFLRLISEILQKEGSLEKSFQKFYISSDETLESAMISWMNHLQAVLISMQG